MIYQQFSKIAQLYKDQVALCAGDRVLTYGELDGEVERLASVLISKEIASGSTVVSLLPNGIEFFIAALASFKVGATFAPLNVSYTDSEIKHYLEMSKATAVIAEADSQQSRVHSINSSVEFIDTSATISPNPACEVTVAPQAPALIMFSSGSAGGSKQVVRSYSALYAEWESEVATFGLSKSDVILCTVPLHHTHGFGNCLLAGILSGVKIVITLGEFNPRSVIKALDAHSVTIYPSATFMVKMLSAMRLRKLPDLSHLKIIYTAGAPLEQTVIDDFESTFGVKPKQLYGSTETGAVAVNYCNAPDNSVGKPLANVNVIIVDNNDKIMEPTKEGEIVVSTASVAQRYVGLPEATAKTFRDGRYYTDDLGYIDENGFLFVTGRRKKMINVAGLKVDPAEVEKVLLDIPEVLEVVVLGKPDGDYGEKVKAVIVPPDVISEAGLINHCKVHLAEYKWPKLIEFRTSIPKSPLGKILRKYL